MKTRAAAVVVKPTREAPGKYETIEVELDEPGQGELLGLGLVQGVAAAADPGVEAVGEGERPR